MEAIIPRWEWSTFGASFGEADLTEVLYQAE
jgi:hypothetical protein